MATDLMTLNIRRRLDKGEAIKGNEIRMLLAMIDTLKARIASLETQLTETPKVEVKPEAVQL